MGQELDYSPVLDALSIADQDFTEEHGCGVHFSLFDENIKSAAVKYNEQHKTNFDPTEALHLYLERCEAKPHPVVSEEIEVNVDDLEVESNPDRSIH